MVSRFAPKPTIEGAINGWKKLMLGWSGLKTEGCCTVKEIEGTANIHNV
jgi:hypothetical protein